MSKEGGADGLANMLADLAGLCAEDVAETAHRQADNKARRRFLERGSVSDIMASDPTVDFMKTGDFRLVEQPEWMVLAWGAAGLHGVGGKCRCCLSATPEVAAVLQGKAKAKA
jgi:hypothetical protein